MTSGETCESLEQRTEHINKHSKSPENHKTVPVCVFVCVCVCVVSLEWLAHLLKHMQEEDNNNDNKKIERKKGNSTNAN